MDGSKGDAVELRAGLRNGRRSGSQRQRADGAGAAGCQSRSICSTMIHPSLCCACSGIWVADRSELLVAHRHRAAMAMPIAHGMPLSACHCAGSGCRSLAWPVRPVAGPWPHALTAFVYMCAIFPRTQHYQHPHHASSSSASPPAHGRRAEQSTGASQRARSFRSWHSYWDEQKPRGWRGYTHTVR